MTERVRAGAEPVSHIKADAARPHRSFKQR